MGILLRPGHKSSNKEGWGSTSFDNILSDIDINIVDVGFWGEQIYNSNIKDAHSILYSIPSPWASAYLYSFIITGGNLGEKLLKIQTKLFDKLIYLLYEYAINRKLELVEINVEGSLKSSIKTIPEFLIFDQNKIYAFYENNKIVGGLSKRSLIWVSQLYNIKNEIIEKIKKDPIFIFYINHLKEQNKILEKEFFNKFWGVKYFSELPKDLSDKKEIKIEETTSVLPKVLIPSIAEGKYYVEKIKSYVFTNKVIDEERELFSNVNLDDDLKNELKKSGYGKEIPRIGIKANWIVIDNFIEKKALKLEALSSWSDKVPYRKEDLIETLDLDTGLLYPINAGLIKALRGNLDLLKFDKKYNKDNKRLYNLQISCGNAKTSLIPDKEVVSLNKILEIWPPFKSKYVDNYVFEYAISSKSNGKFDSNYKNILKFYDSEGDEIETKVNKFEDFNVYKLSKFPTYLVFNESDDENIYSGALRLKEIKKNQNIRENETVEIAIDFGSTRTNIAYKIQQNKPEILEFSNSLPIVIASSDSDLEILKQRFIPYKWKNIDSQNINLEEIIDDPQPSIPFLSIYRNWLISEHSLSFKDNTFSFGSIYFNLPNKSTNESLLRMSSSLLITNLKWGIGSGNIAKFRTYFLQQLVEMVLVEFESRGYENLNIYWSYPKAFSQEEFNQLKATWDNLHKKFIKNR